MIITCNECNSSFNVEDSLINASGSKVRCSRCKNIFVAYPQTPEDDLELDPDEQLLGSNGNIVLDDLDSTLDNFFSEENSLDMAAPQKDADQELELGLGLDAEPEGEEDRPAAVFETEETDLALDELEDLLAAEDTMAGTAGDLDLDLDLNDDSDTTTAVGSMDDNELPDLDDLEDLSALDDDIISVLEDLDVDSEADKKAEVADSELGLDNELDLSDLELGDEDSSDFESSSAADSEGPDLDLQLDLEAESHDGDDIADTGAEALETDEVDLADLALESDDAPVAEKTTGMEPEELDLDFDLDSGTHDSNKSADTGADVLETDKLDLADLALDTDDAPVAEKTTGMEPEELDLDFDLAAETPDGNEIADTDAEVLENDELDLADLALDTDDAPVAENTTGMEPEELDLDFDLATETPDGNEIADTDAEVLETDELDLADLALDTDDAPVAENTTGMEPEELDLDFDLAAETPDGNEIADTDAEVLETDKLDLADLALDTDDAPVAENTTGMEPEELDLDFDPAPEAVTGDSEDGPDELDLSDLQEIMGSEPRESTEDLELDLELPEDKKAQPTDSAAAADNDELDFSDLEKMLESDEAPAAAAEDNEDADLELQFDIDEQPSGDVDAQASGDTADASGEDDLLDIEKILNESEDSAGEDLDSPLEMETSLDNSSSEDDDLELDFDLEGELQEKENFSDGMAIADEPLESNLLRSDETEEAELEDESLQGAVTTDDFATGELMETKDAYSLADEAPVSEDRPSVRPMTRRKSRSKTPVLVAVLLLLLAGGILIVPNMIGIKIPYISDIKIPYLSDLLNPEEKDVSGKLDIIPLGETIEARFVDDSKGGRLFVIHGKIKNDYDHPRSFIKVTGKIYQKGGKLAKTETVYCGNVLSDSDLTGMTIAVINKRLHNKFGDKKSNLKVKTGETIPFMIVFDKLPQNLDEYTVEVDGSSI